jgi:rubrerythrin
MAGNPECKKDGHKMHMCSIKAEELEKMEPEKYTQLTENPQFECGNCGAKVKNSENVCDPVDTISEQ